MKSLSDTVIKYTDAQLGNVAYIQRSARGNWYCKLDNGMQAGFSYAGIKHDRETEFEIDMRRAKDIADVKAALLRHAYNYRSYKFI